MVFEEDLRRLEPVIGKTKALQLWRLYQQEDAYGRRDMEAAVALQVEKQLGVDPLSPDQCLSVPAKDQATGDYILGDVVVGSRVLHPFGLREDEFIQHAAIFGRSGAGKTNTVALLIKELVRHGKPMMIFDWKRNYRDLLDGSDPVPLEVYTVGRSIRPLHFNPLIPPPQTDIKIWLKKLIEIISHAYYLGEGVMFMLLDALDHVYSASGCYDTPNPARYPTMQDVLRYLQSVPVKGRKALWLDSTLRAVQSLCFGQISDVINVSHNDSILDLLNKNVCLELNALANAEKVFLIETLMVWIHHFRMLETGRETFKHCLIIEEAHNILSPAGKETVIDTLLREIRELGESIVLVDQHPSQISIPAMGNTYCTIALNMKHSKDINALAEMMQVPRDNREVFGTLPLGRAIVKLQSRYVQPFQIQIPKVEIRKGVITDGDLSQFFASPADYSCSASESVASPSVRTTEPIPPAHRKEAEPPQSNLTPLQERLLFDIRDHPLDGVVRRYNRLGVSRRRGNHAKEDLIAKGILSPVEIPTKTGKVVLMDFTGEMKEAMKRNNIPQRHPREGGLAHAYWVNQLQAALDAKDWQTATEQPLGNGMAVDLVGTKDSVRVAVEVETGTRGYENIHRLLPHGYDWILSFSVSDEVEVRTRRDLKQSGVHMNHLIFVKPNDYENKIAFLSKR
jgi:hypothetical protein